MKAEDRQFVIDWLIKYGYLPESASTVSVSANVVTSAIRKMQLLYGEELCGRCDGVVNEQTLKAMKLPRCGVKDVVLRSGSGSWPESCHHSGITVSVDFTLASAEWRNQWQSLFDWAVQRFGDVGLKLVPFESGQRANIRISFRRFAGNVIGMAEFNNETCSDSVFCQLHPDYKPNWKMMVLLLLHEMGHNMNLDHTRGGIMNPSILEVDPYWVKWDNGKAVYKDVSYPTLVRFFGGNPIPGPTPPPERIPNAPTDLVANVTDGNVVRLSWKDNSDNEDGFKIYRFRNGQVWTLYKTTNPNVTSFSDFDVDPDTTYMYKVVAFNALGDSMPSNVVSVHTNPTPSPEPPEPPIPPIPWEKIIEIIIALIGASFLVMGKENKGEIKRLVKEPGPWQRLRFERAVRKALGLKPNEWKKVREQIMNQIYEKGKYASDELVDTLVSEGLEWAMDRQLETAHRKIEELTK